MIEKYGFKLFMNRNLINYAFAPSQKVMYSAKVIFYGHFEYFKK